MAKIRMQVDIYPEHSKRLEGIQKACKARKGHVPTMPALVNEALTTMIPVLEDRYHVRRNDR